MRTVLTACVGLFLVGTMPAQEIPRPERLISFDPQRVEVAWNRDGWSLKCGNQILKEFGRRQTEAFEALRLIRDLNLTERGVVGAPTPILEYWLTGGQAPAGPIRGQRAQPIDLASLRLDHDGGQFCLRDAQRVLFNFGYSKEDAEQALAILRKYNFSRVVLIGQATPTMMVFHRTPSALLTGHAQRQPGRLLLPKKAEETPPENPELAAIRNYVPPAIPSLRDPASARLAFPAGDPAMHAGIAPPTTIPGVTDRILRVPFDWRQVQLRLDPDGWLLHAGSLVLARFGRDETMARRALLAMQHYRFNEWCLVGSSEAQAHFYTINGLAPRGELFGVPSVAVVPEQLTVQKTEAGHALAQGQDVLLQLGHRPEDARQLLDWVQRHRVDRLARLTTPDGRGMMFFYKR